MNYKTINKPKFNLINYIFNKTISHNKSSHILLNYFSRVCKLISNLTSNSTNSHYNKNIINYDNKGYNITDTTELRLIASTRTFM